MVRVTPKIAKPQARAASAVARDRAEERTRPPSATPTSGDAGRDDAIGGARVSRIARVVEWAAAAIALASVVVLHVVRLTHAGPLWRDEASTVYLATLPSWSDVWHALPYDHCPPMIHLAVRSWSALGFAGTDFGLRTLGFVLGLLLPAAFFTASWMMRRGAPLLALALACANVTMIAVSDSFRGYGLGGVAVVLAVACLWRLAERPGVRRAVVAALAAVFSVQCLYQNAFFVLAACCGAALLCVLHRRWRDVLLVGAAGLAAAASLLPYLPILHRSQEWYALEKAGFSFATGWGVFSEAAGSPVAWFPAVWVAVCVLTLVGGAWAIVARRRVSSAAPARDLALFGSASLVVGVAGFALFLVLADLPTQVWYYTPLMAFVAVCVDAALPVVHRWATPATAVLAVATVIAALPLGLPSMELRQSNIDQVAAKVADNASPDDLVIVHPWYFGATFARYYHGQAAWTTLPQLTDHFLHRYDLLKIEMQKEHALQPVLDMIDRTLRSGHRVWIAGYVPLDVTYAPDVQPAPANPWGWLDDQYSLAWGQQAGAFLRNHARTASLVIDPTGTPVNPQENIPLAWVGGWR